MSDKIKLVKGIFFLFMIFVNFGPLFSQDVHFSQFDVAPSKINPAHTGNYTGDWRFINTYRTQWFVISKPYVTATISYDHHFYFHNDILSSGILFLSDRSGNLGLTTNQFYLNQAYQKNIGNHTTHIGFQLGYVWKKLSFKNLTYPEQFDMGTGYFSNQLPDSEPALDVSTSYWDVNTGIVWNRNYGKVRPEAGIALFHINYPNVLFGEDFTISTGADKNQKELQMRKVFHTKTEIIFNKTFSLIPCFGYMGQGSANEIIAGAIWKHNVQKENKPASNKLNSILAAVYMRNGFKRNFDAIILGTGINFDKMSVLLSYDCTLSKLSMAANTLGAFEISLIYTAISTRHSNRFVPDYRF